MGGRRHIWMHRCVGRLLRWMRGSGGLTAGGASSILPLILVHHIINDAARREDVSLQATRRPHESRTWPAGLSGDKGTVHSAHKLCSSFTSGGGDTPAERHPSLPLSPHPICYHVTPRYSCLSCNFSHSQTCGISGVNIDAFMRSPSTLSPLSSREMAHHQFPTSR